MMLSLSTLKLIRSSSREYLFLSFIANGTGTIVCYVYKIILNNNYSEEELLLSSILLMQGITNIYLENIFLLNFPFTKKTIPLNLI
jgi:hypothetical protein